MTSKFLIITTLVVSLPLISSLKADPELENLRNNWKNARAAALTPVDQKYRQALKVLKDKLTKAGRLEEALAVEEELKATSGFGGGNITTRLNEATLTTGQWRFDAKSPAYTTHLTFGKNNEIFERGKNGPIGKWRFTGNTIRAEFKYTWNEFSVEYEGEPVLTETRCNEGKREGVTLTQIP